MKVVWAQPIRRGKKGQKKKARSCGGKRKKQPCKLGKFVANKKWDKRPIGVNSKVTKGEGKGEGRGEEEGEVC